MVAKLTYGTRFDDLPVEKERLKVSTFAVDKMTTGVTSCGWGGCHPVISGGHRRRVRGVDRKLATEAGSAVEHRRPQTVYPALSGWHANYY